MNRDLFDDMPTFVPTYDGYDPYKAPNVIDRWFLFCEKQNCIQYDRDFELVSSRPGDVLYVSFTKRKLITQHPNGLESPYSQRYLLKMCA